jgi:hypothetical protein
VCVLIEGVRWPLEPGGLGALGGSSKPEEIRFVRASDLISLSPITFWVSFETRSAINSWIKIKKKKTFLLIQGKGS